MARAESLPAALVGLALLAAGVGGTILALRGADTTRAAIPLTVREIWQDAEAHRGKLVRTSGLVRAISRGTADEHYVLEEAGQFRVGLRGISRDRLRRLEGRQATDRKSVV